MTDLPLNTTEKTLVWTNGKTDILAAVINEGKYTLMALGLLLITVRSSTKLFTLYSLDFLAGILGKEGKVADGGKTTFHFLLQQPT